MDLSPFIYGTTRLGEDSIPFNQRVDVATAAMDCGIWFHTSHTYGDALKVLRLAFDSNRTKVPKLIAKIGWSTASELRDVIREHLDQLAISFLDIGQLCLGGELAEQFRNGGDCYEEFIKIRDEGLVKQFVLEVFPWTSHIPLAALQAGYSDRIIDGYIFYLNPLQRFASNELWDRLHVDKAAIIAMRTVSGGPVLRLRDVPGAAWKEYLQKRAVEAAPLFEKSGISDWTEFCVRFAHSFPQVQATVGSTSRIENLDLFLKAAQDIKPLPAWIIDEFQKLHYRWSNETDIHAEPWSM